MSGKCHIVQLTPNRPPPNNCEIVCVCVEASKKQKTEGVRERQMNSFFQHLFFLFEKKYVGIVSHCHQGLNNVVVTKASTVNFIFAPSKIVFPFLLMEPQVFYIFFFNSCTQHTKRYGKEIIQAEMFGCLRLE